MSVSACLRVRRGAVMIATLALALACSTPAAGAEKPAAPPGDDLDVTMQVIADPNAKLPDDIIRRIPLPPRKPDAAQSATNQPATTQSATTEEPSKGADPAQTGEERSREAQEMGREMSERAQERTQDAAEQRERARRSVADERRRNPEPPGPPRDPPRPPR